MQVVNYKMVLAYGWEKLYSELLYALAVPKEAYHMVIDEEWLITLKKVQCAFSIPLLCFLISEKM